MYSKEIAEEAKRIGMRIRKSNLEVVKHINELVKHVNIIKKDDDGDEDGSFPDSLLFCKSNYQIIDTYNKKPPHIPYEFEIFVSPNKSFLAKFDIFLSTTITFSSASQCRRWLGGPNFSYWPQQLNFAVWCATAGCGVSLNENYPPQIQQFMQFHVYFTIRRILWELQVPLPKETIFSQTRNKYNKIVLSRLYQEFNLPTKNDFRFKGGQNHGLGTIFVRWNGNWAKPPIESNLIHWPNQIPIFHDEPGIGGQVGKIVNQLSNGKQYEWFSPEAGMGLTKPGIGRLNRSIESFLYCIVGAEANARSSILELKGSHTIFLRLFRESIIEDDLTKSIINYQNAIQDAKLKLDFAIAPDLWLTPSNLIINTESKISYNNNLKSVTPTMKFGVNSLVNFEYKNVGIGASKPKIKLPHQNEKESPKILYPKIEDKKMEDNESPNEEISESYDSHELNKISLIILFGGLGYWLFG